MRLTVGPLPPAVYWRRRAVVLGGVIAVIFTLTYACSSAAGGKGNLATKSPSPSTEAPQVRAPRLGGLIRAGVRSILDVGTR